MLTFKYPDHSPPILLKQLLATKGVSLTLWRKIKRSGTMLVNDLAHPVWLPIHGGDRIHISWPENQTIPAIEMPLSIIYEDEYLLAIDKPAGIPVHPTQYHPTNTLANAISFYYANLQLPIGFHPVHRLDRNTSGLLLIAKSPVIQHLLSQNMKKLFTRTYLAIVEGTFTITTDIIDAPIARSPDSIIKRTVNEKGQPATTKFTVLQSLESYSLLRLELLTGRTHQIRVHLSHIGHPLLGDDLYGGSTELIKRQALHAIGLDFYHPILKKKIDLHSHLPEDMAKLLNWLPVN